MSLSPYLIPSTNYHLRVRAKFFLPMALLSFLSFFCVIETGSAQVPNGRGKERSHDVNDPRSRFNGRIIRSVTIEVREIFDDVGIGPFYRTVNDAKIQTKHEIVNRELLFKEGEKFDYFLIQESERNLRLAGYLASAEIKVVEAGDLVDLFVVVQDTWTFIPQLGYSTGTGKNSMTAGISESNLAGMGKRMEVLYSENDGRRGMEFVYDDPRFMASKDRFVAGYFTRNDGDRTVFQLGRPYRSLKERDSWLLYADNSDTIGRLFENGDERYIYRQERIDLQLQYSYADGDPDRDVRRYGVGFRVTDDKFSQATEQDFEDLDLDPSEVSNDPTVLAEDRRFVGPSLSYERIIPDYISLDYIDRFERVQDYNLGKDSSFGAMFAPEILGSINSALLLNANTSAGTRFTERSFARWEFGLNSRAEETGFQNTLARGEFKIFHSFDRWMVGDLSLGRHTLAGNFFLDYGNRLDRDREFLAGSDNVVRGYKAKTFAGDKRFGLNLEDRVHFADNLFRLVSFGGALFFDAGAATNDTLGEMFSDNVYSNVGFGLRFAFPRSSGGRIIRVDIAFPLREGPDGSDVWEPRIVIQGGQLFDSRLRSETFGPERSNVEIGLDR